MYRVMIHETENLKEAIMSARINLSGMDRVDTLRIVHSAGFIRGTSHLIVAQRDLWVIY